MAEAKVKWWHNGALVEPSELNVSIQNYSLHYGACLFEGIRCYAVGKGKGIFRLEDHIRRLYESARIVGFRIEDHTPTEFAAAVVSVAESSPLRDLYIRPMYFYGEGVMGIKSPSRERNAAVIAWDWETPRETDPYTKGARLAFAAQRKHSSLIMAKVSGNYLTAFAAANATRGQGIDEVVMLDDAGNVSEGSAQNIFMVKGGRISTPSLRSCLAGITRDTVLEICRHSGIPCEERDISPAELRAADEIFLTGTASEIMPVQSLDGLPMRGISPDSLTQRIRNAYAGATKGTLAGFERRNWITHIGG
jgi:branched-chain amino acid aminotransferase